MILSTTTIAYTTISLLMNPPPRRPTPPCLGLVRGIFPGSIKRTYTYGCYYGTQYAPLVFENMAAGDPEVVLELRGRRAALAEQLHGDLVSPLY